MQSQLGPGRVESSEDGGAWREAVGPMETALKDVRYALNFVSVADARRHAESDLAEE